MGEGAHPLPVDPGTLPRTPACASPRHATVQGIPAAATPSQPLCSHTLSANCPQRVHIMSVDELLLEHHLDGDDDLGHDDQQVPCGKASQGEAGLHGVGVDHGLGALAGWWAQCWGRRFPQGHNPQGP